jgi:hypothetical protein
MTPSATVWLIATAFVVVAGTIVVITLASDVTYQRDELPGAGPDRSTAERHRAQEWVAVWMHVARPRPPTVEQAHRDMQLHCECQRQACPRKYAAYDVLVAEGILRPGQRAVVR